MSYLCGQEFEITGLHPRTVEGHGTAWNVSRDMIEHFDQDNITFTEFLGSYATS